jgi:hypothetical protein
MKTRHATISRYRHLEFEHFEDRRLLSGVVAMHATSHVAGHSVTGRLPLVALAAAIPAAGMPGGAIAGFPSSTISGGPGAGPVLAGPGVALFSAGGGGAARPISGGGGGIPTSVMSPVFSSLPADVSLHLDANAATGPIPSDPFGPGASTPTPDSVPGVNNNIPPDDSGAGESSGSDQSDSNQEADANAPIDMLLRNESSLDELLVANVSEKMILQVSQASSKVAADVEAFIQAADQFALALAE